MCLHKGTHPRKHRGLQTHIHMHSQIRMGLTHSVTQTIYPEVFCAQTQNHPRPLEQTSQQKMRSAAWHRGERTGYRFWKKKLKANPSY